MPRSPIFEIPRSANRTKVGLKPKVADAIIRHLGIGANRTKVGLKLAMTRPAAAIAATC